MALFGRKNEPQKAAAPLTLDQIMYFKQLGMSNEQIAQNLRSQGYNLTEIYDKIGQAEMGGPAGPSFNPENQGMQEPQFGQEQPPSMERMEAPMMPQSSSAESKERIEEIAEAIIDEKWNELLADINKVIEWKDKTDTVVVRMQQEIKDLRASFDSLHKGVLGK